MIDIEGLLSPIRDDSPSGPDLRLDPEKEVIFGRVKDFRQVLDPAVDPVGKGKEPDWGASSGRVRRRCAPRPRIWS